MTLVDRELTASGGGAGSTRGEEYFDVIIVGARCAGSTLAAMLGRAGLKVVVLEQAVFPRETLSSHLMEADGLLFLKRLGVLDAVLGTGVRFHKRIAMRLNDERFEANFPLRFDDLGGAAFLRRHLLDAILADAAAEAGADMRMGTKVVELLWDDDKRVTGVRAQTRTAEYRLRAPLVVGADGRASTIGYMVGSHRYNVIPSERSYYFTFFEGADPACDDQFVFHRWGDRMVWAGPADSGLYLVGVSPEAHEREFFRRHTEIGLLEHMRSCDDTARALSGARIATKIAGIRRFDGYMRQASGPGWVLVGDAGHFKDPALGRGIGDAFLQTEALAPAIVSGLDGSALDELELDSSARGGSARGASDLGASGPDRSKSRIDLATRRWGQWRDRRFEGHYWLATNLGRAGALPEVIPQAVRRLEERGEMNRFLDLFSHRAKYDEVLPLRQLGAETGRMLVSGEHKRAPLVRETVKLLAREPLRRWHALRPALAPTDLTPAPPDRLAPAAGAPAEACAALERRDHD